MEENNQQSVPEQSKGTSPLLIVGMVVVIAVILGAFWFTNNQSKNKQSSQTAQTEQNPTAVPTTVVTEAVMAQAISIEGGNYYFKPNEIKVKKGEKVTITFNNVSSMMHDFVIDEFDVKSETITKGATTVEFTPDKTGTFEFYCSVGTHRKMGMKGNLIVE